MHLVRFFYIAIKLSEISNIGESPYAIYMYTHIYIYLFIQSFFLSSLINLWSAEDNNGGNVRELPLRC